MTGVFEQAHGGTLFLDEIGDSLLSFQIKLLRVLQEKQVRRIGDDKLIPVDVRVIVATNKDIAQLVRERSFREDLYYRLNVLPLHLLPLRERRADILPLAREFYREMASSLPKLSLFDVFFAGKLDELMQYDFPGNARQLRNVVEFLVCTSENGLCPDISPAFGEVVPSRPRPLQDEQIVLEALREREKRGEASGRRSLAVATGLSEDRVKKALAILRESGSVGDPARPRGNRAAALKNNTVGWKRYSFIPLMLFNIPFLTCERGKCRNISVQSKLFELAHFLLSCKQKQKDGKKALFPSHSIIKQEVSELCSPLEP